MESQNGRKMLGVLLVIKWGTFKQSSVTVQLESTGIKIFKFTCDCDTRSESLLIIWSLAIALRLQVKCSLFLENLWSSSTQSLQTLLETQASISVHEIFAYSFFMERKMYIHFNSSKWSVCNSFCTEKNCGLLLLVCPACMTNISNKHIRASYWFAWSLFEKALSFR